VNVVAHECVCYACEHVIDSVSLDFSPEFLKIGLQADCKDLVLS
jgi:hypothetical protein